MKKERILLGAHTSIAGGVHEALYEGKRIGCTTVQMFTANQRQWKSRSLSQQEVDKFKQVLLETGLSHIMSHSSYLINMGSPDPEVLMKSKLSFREEIIRCMQLGITYLNFHPGSALDDSPQRCLERIVESLLEMRDLFSEKESVKLLIETAAGQGSQVGRSFEEIAYLVNKTKGALPIGVCIDTCHIFAAGYDLRTEEALDNTLKEFDKKVGLPYLEALHLNDSVKGLSSYVDRHAQIGEGKIGLDGFRAIMRHPRLKSLPKYLETPGGPAYWENEIKLLRSFIE
jgi:deoxyribonuclease IV